MSFKANLAITLHLHTFKNLALPHKARYALSAFIYQGKDMKVPLFATRTSQSRRISLRQTSNLSVTSASRAKLMTVHSDLNVSTSNIIVLMVRLRIGNRLK